MFSSRLMGLGLLAMLVAPACEQGPPTLEASSEEDLESSAAELRQQLSPEQRASFDSLLGIVSHRGRVVPDGVSDTALASLGDTLRQRLSGRGLEGLRSLADSLRESYLEERLDAQQYVLEYLSDDREVLETVRNLEVVSVRYRPPSEESFSMSPEATVTLENHTDVALSRVRFLGELISPGRTVLWNEGTITIRIRGGLEPGERRTLDYHLNAFRGWAPSELPSDAGLRLEPFVLYGPEGEVYANARSIEPEDVSEAALDSVRNRISRLEAELKRLRSTSQ